MPDALATIAAWLQQENDFLLIAHTSPDGDTIGSCLALYTVLRAMGKQAQVACEHIVPYLYAFLPGAETIVKPEALHRSFSNAIAVDCAVIDRMGSAGTLFNSARETGNIDHHISNNAYGAYTLLDTSASATGEIVFALYQALAPAIPLNIQQDIATLLFVAISTDTGNFAYSNTTPTTLRIAAALMESGIDTAEINRRVYRMVPIGKTRLCGYVLSTMQLFEQGRIGVATILLSDLERLGACVEDVEGMVDGVRDVDTVEIAMILRERRDGGYKASLRSKRYVDVSAIAGKFGGGGHLRAAGCNYDGTLQAFHNEILQAAKEALL